MKRDNTGEVTAQKELMAQEEESLSTEYLAKGGEIVKLSGAELLKNVAQAMGKGGPGHAVDFCNVHALSIQDSLSALYNCEIRRIAEKYRNPEDKPVSKTEKELLKKYQDGTLKGESLEPEVYHFDDRTEYYHPIFINKGACLLCHGVPGEQISGETMAMISANYPEDLATGYAMNDFRGAWKITFMKE